MDEEIKIPETTAAPQMAITPDMKPDMLKAASWGKFLAVMTAIGLAIIVALAIFFMVMGANLPDVGKMGGLGAGVLYLVIALIYLYPLSKAFGFVNSLKAAALTDDPDELARSYASLGSMLKYTGILTIIVLVLYAVILVTLGVSAFVFAKGMAF